MKKLSLKLEVFEGPLDLLMYLIQKNKVNIYDIPISEITHQYLEYLNEIPVPNLEVASKFVAMAARLLYIKSKMLLPKHDTLEDDMEDDDPRKELVDKLIEYKKYKEISLYLKQKNRYKNIYYKQPENIEIDDNMPNL